ncbi:MAG: type II toxin-antitoxin system ParD family antitoxin [Acidobacteria bacterium]|nr:type II toxin-antitoxin system ParD family antitoxin [Acidobacteriota bacterium]MXX85365.1 type II toxin-antitoxin system ParD family antitoxin [Acidobacteriota bacterium]MYE43028.1 type II toxin-antitoxin system ParD family antitoxin [Acidobacteriota bacterium]MYF77127.1 type II toxin-antitoxin system ParD family antitoxin [Acidobacteriota bacterium]MYG76456.1 type II toxin-antitoxin system ParD family antitoxin [Acidobacteriota bacterium]
MSRIQESLPASLESFVDEQVVNRGFATRCAYIRELIRHDRDRQRLRNLLLEGGDSAPSITADSIYFACLRAGTSPDPRIRRNL